MKRKLSYFIIALAIASTIFSLLNIVFVNDVSIVAFPLSLVFSIAIISAYLLLKKKNTYKMVCVLRYLSQYLMYIQFASFIIRRAGKANTNYILDLFSALFWILCIVLSLCVQFYLNPKRAFVMNPEWKEESEKSKKDKSIKKGVLYFLEWVDALVQAVCLVLILNIFIVQLYLIPSESMVPEFLVNDRVVVFKFLSGPKFPLSEVGIPVKRNYKRGDIVVFRNPHYKNDRSSEVKTVLSNFVFMITLTKVNLNVDDMGQPKADPLVKRIVGIPGEQLVMQDGVLYHRTAGNEEFTPVDDDGRWAAWNLNTVSPKLQKNIQVFPLSPEQYETMISCEKERRELNIAAVKAECQLLAERFSSLNPNKSSVNADSLRSLFTNSDMFENILFSQNDSFTRKLLSVDGGSQWFTSFMTDWIDKKAAAQCLNGELVGGNIYDDASFRLNLMIKLQLGRLVVRNTELLLAKVPSASWQQDEYRIACLNEAQKLNLYVMLMDQRNMPVFPANDENGNASYIPANCYFMMGDNRFNSLDMRHSYTQSLVPVSHYDDYSVTYYTNIEPQYVSKSRILGTANYRILPWSRHGVPGVTGMAYQIK